MKTITIILLLFAYVTEAQVQVNEIKMKFGSEYHKAKEPDVVFPVMGTGNKAVDDKINFLAIRELTGEDSVTNFSTVLFRAMNEGLAELDYKITLKTKDLLSYRFDARGCGAYCTSYSIYFNFDLHTGEPLKIENIFNDNAIDSFRMIVFRDKVAALKRSLHEYDSLYAANEIDSSTHQLIANYIKENCIGHVNIEKFILDPESLEIIDDCEFPHFIASMQPVYKLKYYFKSIRRFLKPSFQLIR